MASSSNPNPSTTAGETSIETGMPKARPYAPPETWTPEDDVGRKELIGRVQYLHRLIVEPLGNEKEPPADSSELKKDLDWLRHMHQYSVDYVKKLGKITEEWRVKNNDRGEAKIEHDKAAEKAKKQDKDYTENAEYPNMTWDSEEDDRSMAPIINQMNFNRESWNAMVEQAFKADRKSRKASGIHAELHDLESMCFDQPERIETQIKKFEAELDRRTGSPAPQ